MSMHVMLDIETLGVSTSAAILSIGAVRFDPDHFPQTDPLPGFYCEIDPVSCEAHGLRVEAETVLWWFQPQQLGARAALLDNRDRLDLPTAIGAFIDWYVIGKAVEAIWSNGATFDIMIMRNAMRAVGRGDEIPWNFYQERCYRTMKALLPPAATKTAHHALKDARQQALDLQWIMNELRRRPLPPPKATG